jgi:protein-S-isoprenylcysteine O-methyltransferase Ste14
MEHDPRTPNRTRENIVILTLVLFLGGIVVFFLNVISLGIFTYVIGVGVLIVVVGSVHYFLWGRAMMEDVAVEREQMLLKEEREAELNDHTDGIVDLSHRRGVKRGRPGK